MPKVYTVIVRNHFLENDTGKSEPIKKIFYRETQGHNGRTMAPKTAFANFLSPKQRIAYFPADDFHEI